MPMKSTLALALLGLGALCAAPASAEPLECYTIASQATAGNAFSLHASGQTAGFATANNAAADAAAFAGGQHNAIALANHQVAIASEGGSALLAAGVEFILVQQDTATRAVNCFVEL